MSSPSYNALRDRAAWIDLTGRGKIRATGEDRARLLHSMTTNNIQDLVPGEDETQQAAWRSEIDPVGNLDFARTGRFDMVLMDPLFEGARDLFFGI